MASLGGLPPEIALQVLRDLDIRDLAAIAATCRGYYALANPLLYKLEVQNPESYIFYAAAGSGHVGRMQKLIDAGFDVNQIWVSPLSGADAEDIRIMDLWRKGRCSKEAVILHRQVESERRAKAAKFRYWHLDEMGHFNSTTDNSDLEEDMTDWEAPEFLGASRRTLEAYHIFWAALHLAAANGQDEAVCFLIDKGANIDAPSKKFCECQQVKVYVTYDEDSHLPLWSPLHMAICRGHLQTARLLLNRGASIFVEIDGLEGLESKSDSVSADTSAAAADPTTRPRNQNRCTALHAACFHGEYSLVKTLIEDGYQSQLEVEDILGQTPLAYAFCAHQYGAIIPYLQNKGCDINIKVGNPTEGVFSCPVTPLMMACQTCQYQDAIRLVELGADVNYVNPETNETPLHGCISSAFNNNDEKEESKRDRLIHELLKAGANVNSAGKHGFTPLYYAANNMDARMAKTLIQHGADVAARDFGGETILTFVCNSLPHLDLDLYEQEILRLVNLLISHEADVNARNRQNLTALHIVHGQCLLRTGSLALLKVLLSHGASVTLRDNSGLLPFHQAFRNGQLELCSLLFSEEVKILLTEDDISDMFLSLFEPYDPDHINPIPGLFNLLLDAGGGFLLSQPETLKMALDYGAKNLIPLLVDKRTFTSFVSNSGETVLHRGCQSGIFERKPLIAQLLDLDMELDINATTEDGETLLFIYFATLHQGYMGFERKPFLTVRRLLEQGADPHQLVNQIPRDSHADYFHCERPLDVAIYTRQYGIARTTLRECPIQGDTSHYSYLHRSCSFQNGPAHKGLVSYLLQRGFDANSISCFGETPLFHMLHTFKPGLPSRNSSHGGLKPVTRTRYMAVDHIQTLLECIELLEDHGARWNVRNSYPRDGRWTPIDELQHLLSYDGQHSRSRGELDFLRKRLRKKEWDIEDVGEDFFLFG
ncbi:ankyrin [Xylaria acuta]|nr:ankyrin [Xylaria acuta]